MEALKASDKALEIAPNYLHALHHKGVALACTHNYEDALRCFERVFDIDPSFPHARDNLERAAKKLGKKDDARKYISKAKERGFKI